MRRANFGATCSFCSHRDRKRSTAMEQAGNGMSLAAISVAWCWLMVWQVQCGSGPDIISGVHGGPSLLAEACLAMSAPSAGVSADASASTAG
eukprot:13482766-Alexandrium_andersonii.AAC.1